MGAIFAFFMFYGPAIIILIEFLWFIIKGKRLFNLWMVLVELVVMIFFPFFYANFGVANDCCADRDLGTAVFSPDHYHSIATLVILCIAAYFYSRLRKTMISPIIKILVNVGLVICLVLNVVIAIHTGEVWIAMIGNFPIILLTIMALAENHKFVKSVFQTADFHPEGRVEKFTWKVLSLEPVYKYPILMLLALPVLVVLTLLLLLIGQKPDSMIRAFTETYKHGLSQIDYQCDNVHCGGHYLCSVAANGHKSIVMPERLGERNGKPIICNRQLLVSNAFEDLLQEKLPRVHRFIRSQYNKVGKMVHRYYNVFNCKPFADLIYILMKPLEWFFLLVLYTFDRKPENRIAKQYLSPSDRSAIDNGLR
jgi:hypothetical protein